MHACTHPQAPLLQQRGQLRSRPPLSLHICHPFLALARRSLLDVRRPVWVQRQVERPCQQRQARHDAKWYKLLETRPVQFQGSCPCQATGCWAAATHKGRHDCPHGIHLQAHTQWDGWVSLPVPGPLHPTCPSAGGIAGSTVAGCTRPVTRL